MFVCTSRAASYGQAERELRICVPRPHQRSQRIRGLGITASLTPQKLPTTVISQDSSGVGRGSRVGLRSSLDRPEHSERLSSWANQTTEAIPANKTS